MFGATCSVARTVTDSFSSQVARLAIQITVVFQKWRWTAINVTLGLIFVTSLIHAAANFAAFFAFRGLSINESTFCFMVWK
jgi:hypothetical protein